MNLSHRDDDGYLRYDLRMAISRSVMVLAVLCIGAAPASSPAPAVAAPPDAPDEVIRYRQLVMRSMASHLKAISPLASKRVNAPKHLVVHAKAVADTAKMVGDLFPKGTGAVNNPDSEALDSIWKNEKGWHRAVEALKAESEKLSAAAAAGDLAAVRAQIEVTNDTCAACHKLFRAEK